MQYTKHEPLHEHELRNHLGHLLIRALLFQAWAIDGRVGHKEIYDHDVYKEPYACPKVVEPPNDVSRSRKSMATYPENDETFRVGERGVSLFGRG